METVTSFIKVNKGYPDTAFHSFHPKRVPKGPCDSNSGPLRGPFGNSDVVIVHADVKNPGQS